MLWEDAPTVDDDEDDDDEGTRPVAEPVGDTALLADLGTSAEELLGAVRGGGPAARRRAHRARRARRLPPTSSRASARVTVRVRRRRCGSRSPGGRSPRPRRRPGRRRRARPGRGRARRGVQRARAHRRPDGARRGARPARRGRGSGRVAADGCTLVVTLEPCTMCAGALVLARVARRRLRRRRPQGRRGRLAVGRAARPAAQPPARGGRRRARGRVRARCCGPSSRARDARRSARLADGGVSERPKEHASKACDGGNSSVGSNPTATARGFRRKSSERPTKVADDLAPPVSGGGLVVPGAPRGPAGPTRGRFRPGNDHRGSEPLRPGMPEPQSRTGRSGCSGLCCVCCPGPRGG